MLFVFNHLKLFIFQQHGYRLPEEDSVNYCQVRFWRGEPLTYPKICLTRNFPVVTPMPNPNAVCTAFLFQVLSSYYYVTYPFCTLHRHNMSAFTVAIFELLEGNLMYLLAGPTYLSSYLDRYFFISESCTIEI